MSRFAWGWSLGAAVGLIAAAPTTGVAQQATTPTFHRDVVPILQRSCQRCHREASLAPMSLITYPDVRRYAARIRERTGLRGRMGTMPPWFIDRQVGIQHFANDEALTEAEIATLAAWADAGAPEGNAADAPPALVFAAEPSWDIGEPDLIVDLPPFTMEANAPDWWGRMQPAQTGLAQDRYVQAMQVLEISDVEGGAGGQAIYHHAILASTDASGRSNAGWPVHEVGRNAQYFDAEASPMLPAGSSFLVSGAHMNSNATRTTAFLRLGFKFHPPEYQPARRSTMLTFGNGEIDLRPMEAGQIIDVYHTLTQNMKISTFEPHMHASGVRMCFEAVWGGRTETISCAGYDHNWVKVYNYDEDHAPLLPKGTLIRIVAEFDTTPANRNVIDPRNWQGLGHRSIDNMAIVFLPGITLTDAEFAQEIANRRERMGLAVGEAMIGCPLCGFATVPVAQP